MLANSFVDSLWWRKLLLVSAVSLRRLPQTDLRSRVVNRRFDEWDQDRQSNTSMKGTLDLESTFKLGTQTDMILLKVDDESWRQLMYHLKTPRSGHYELWEFGIWRHEASLCLKVERSFDWEVSVLSTFQGKTCNDRRYHGVKKLWRQVPWKHCRFSVSIGPNQILWIYKQDCLTNLLFTHTRLLCLAKKRPAFGAMFCLPKIESWSVYIFFKLFVSAIISCLWSTICVKMDILRLPGLTALL